MPDNTTIERLYEIFLAHPTVTTDSRKVPAGSVFFALHGDRFDGNRFAAGALEAGAAYAVVDDPQTAVSDRYIVVKDTLVALQQLARHHRMQMGIPVVGITGTNGKTTTKELTAAVLSRKFRITVTQGNLNNHIGVPLTLLSIKGNTEMAVIEMGASAVGEIALLCDIARPNYGLITNIGRAHLEGFGGIEGVRKGKSELYDYLAATGGTAFVCGSISELVEMASERKEMKTILYDIADASEYHSNLTGDYNAYNIAAAVAIGKHFGIGEKERMEAIAVYEPANGRSQRVETGHNTLILDCYNANPSSMRAAIKDFAAEDSVLPKTVILGDMLELGEYTSTEHNAILDLLGECRLDDVYLVGSNFSKTAQGKGLRTFPDRDALAGYLAEAPLSGKLVLLKGSRNIGLETIAELL